TTTSEILGSGTAAYPVSVIIPTSIKAVFDEVVAQATLNIANNTTYQSPYPKFKYTYDQFATATLVDRFTQFWRTFNYNLLTLLAKTHTSCRLLKRMKARWIPQSTRWAVPRTTTPYLRTPRVVIV